MVDWYFMRSKPGKSCLVLNASYEAIMVISSKRAIILLLLGKAESVQDDEDRIWESPSYAISVPVIIRLFKYINIPHSSVGLSRRALYVRDQGKCVYCGSTQNLTIDHVIPRSRGGSNEWNNLVIACRECNHKKGHKTLEQMGWRLDRPPKAPVGPAWRIMGHRDIDPRWQEYLKW